LPSYPGSAEDVGWVGRSGVEVEARHHELSWETVSHNYLRDWGAGNFQAAQIHIVTALLVRPFNALLNQLSDVLDARNLRGLVCLRELGVFVVAGNIGLFTLPTGFDVDGVAGAK